MIQRAVYASFSLLVLLFCFLHTTAQLSTTEVFSRYDEETGNTIVTCMAFQFETMNWVVTTESSDFELAIDSGTVQHSASNDVRVADGITLSSAITTSSNLQKKSGNSTIIIDSSFPSNDNFMFSCTTFHSEFGNGGFVSSTQSGSLTIFIRDTDTTDPPNSDDNLTTVITLSVAVPLIVLVIGSVVFCVLVHKCKAKRKDTSHALAQLEDNEPQNSSRHIPPLTTQTSSSPIIPNSQSAPTTSEPEYLSLTGFGASDLLGTAAATTPVTMTSSDTCTHVHMTHNEAYGILNGSSNIATTTHSCKVQRNSSEEEDDDYYY